MEKLRWLLAQSGSRRSFRRKSRTSCGSLKAPQIHSSWAVSAKDQQVVPPPFVMLQRTITRDGRITCHEGVEIGKDHRSAIRGIAHKAVAFGIEGLWGQILLLVDKLFSGLSGVLAGAGAGVLPEGAGLRGRPKRGIPSAGAAGAAAGAVSLPGML